MVDRTMKLILVAIALGVWKIGLASGCLPNDSP